MNDELHKLENIGGKVKMRSVCPMVFLVIHLPLSAMAQPVEHTPKEYVTVANMRCGSTNIQVLTYCESGPAESPDCFLQKVRFTSPSAVRQKLYLYENYKKDMSLISDLLCVKGKQEDKIVLQSTNLGNCKVCEWQDYFDMTGKFLGSDRVKFGATNSKPKPLARNFYRVNAFALDENGRFVEVERVAVNRSQR